MIYRQRYLIPVVGAGTEEDPYRPEWEPTEPGEFCRFVRWEDSDMVCDTGSVTEHLPYPKIW